MNLRWLDDLLNEVTMYRLVLYGLAVLAGISVIFSYMGALPFSGNFMLLSLAVLLLICHVGNKIFATLFNAPTNVESSLITALILFCILPPVESVQDAALVTLCGLIAMASKYLIALNRKHIFNPAAFGAFAIGITGLLPATWWIATAAMLPFTFALGFLVSRKIRRYELAASFFITALVVMVGIGLGRDRELGDILVTAFTSWPLVFFAAVMLTEPSTLPPRRHQQIIYGVLIGGLFSSQLHYGILATTPEAVLLLGNVYSYAVSYKRRLRLKLKSKIQMSNRITDYRFVADAPLSFLPGQYMEWTLPHDNVDSRGNRRTFTVATSPTESEVGIGVKFYEPSSSFKQALAKLEIGQYIVADNLAGEFILPKDKDVKLLFIAGGIGITPFRSMLRYILDSKDERNVALIYVVTHPSEVSYSQDLEDAKSKGIRVILVLNGDKGIVGWSGHVGKLNGDLILQEVADVGERLCYISGSPSMVRSSRMVLRSIGVKHSKIKTDYFSGY